MDLNKALNHMYQHRAAQESKKKRKFLDTSLIPSDRFDKLHGCEEARDKLIKIVDYYKQTVEGHLSITEWPVLICGSRYLGKTSIIRAAGNYGGIDVNTLSLRSLAGQTRNEFRETLNQWLKDCDPNKQSIVIFDDLDSLKEKEDLRFTAGEAIKQFMRRAPLCETNPARKQPLVFCTTSSTLEDLPDIDFSFVIYLKRPDVTARFRILKDIRESYASLKGLSDECLSSIARDTPSFTAHELRKMLLISEVNSAGNPSKVEIDKAIETTKHSFKKGTHLLGQRPSITWNDIGGMAHVQKTFRQIMNQARRGDSSCKFAGIALYGPPGCGKTMVAQAMANEAGFNFISVKPAELINKYLGETERNIRRVFHDAREHDPCMIYFDEFDGLCGNRGSKDNITSAIQTLLSEMDGFADRGRSMILASTNRLEDIDPAMKRPGRLSKHVYVGPPDEEARKDILSRITNKPNIELYVDLDRIAKETKKFTGAELAFLVSEAISAAYLENDDGPSDETITLLTDKHFMIAMEEVRKNNRELHKKGVTIPRSS